jgi:hypothetical protein
MQEQTAAAERAYRANVNRFVEMWLSLGSDVLKLIGTRHDAELGEARGLAAHRWGQLFSMEEQIVREEHSLAGRPKKRPVSSTDDTLPDKLIEKQEREWQEKTEDRQAGLAALKEQAKVERKLLEAFVVKPR